MRGRWFHHATATGAITIAALAAVGTLLGAGAVAWAHHRTTRNR